jgi:hypothetical protein
MATFVFSPSVAVEAQYALPANGVAATAMRQPFFLRLLALCLLAMLAMPVWAQPVVHIHSHDEADGHDHHSSIIALKGENYAAAFEQAYLKNPGLPAHLLESLAYATSRMQNMVAEDEHDHGRPQYWGLFGLIEHGGTYFDENMNEVCKAYGVTPTDFKRSGSLQIAAVAHKIHALAHKHGVLFHPIEDYGAVLMEFSEIPQQLDVVNDFALKSYVYNVLFYVQHGIEGGGVRIEAQPVKLERAFDAKTLQLMQAPSVRISIPVEEAPAAKSPSPTIQPGSGSSIQSVQSTDYAPALWDEAATNHFTTRTATISAVAIHTMEGSYAGTISWFNNPNQVTSSGTTVNVSAHYLIRSSDGQITQMVYENKTAYHIGTHNSYTIGIEHEGYVSVASYYTTAMYTASAALVRDICTDYAIAPTSCYQGPSCGGSSSSCALSTSIKIKGHQHFTSQTHTDPGLNWDWYYYYALVNPLATPTLISPANNASGQNNTLAFSWNSVGNATSYRLQIATSPTFTVANGLSNGVVYDQNVGNATSTSVSLNSATTYYWTVRAGNIYGGGNYATPRTFSTLGLACSTPSNISTSNITSNSVQVGWTSIGLSTPSYYSVAYKTASASTWISWGSAYGTSANITGLSSNTTYQFRITAVCAISSTVGNIISATTSAITSTAPANNEICSATTLYPSSACSYTSGTLTGATLSSQAFGGNCGAALRDVWYKFTMPSGTNPQVTIRTAAGSMTDAIMEVYYSSTSSCSATRTYIVCEDDNTNGNGSAMPVINLQGGAGNTIWVRVWGYGSQTGTFSICVMNYNTANKNGSSGNDLAEAIAEGGVFVEVAAATPTALVEMATIMPMPVTGGVAWIQLHPEIAAASIEIWNTQGQQVAAFPNLLNTGEALPLPIGALANGIYALRISTPTATTTLKMVKEN